MKPRDELDLILTLIRKYNLPLSPILEYAVNEKKEEYPEEKPEVTEVDSELKVEEAKASVTDSEYKVEGTKAIPSVAEESHSVIATIKLTREIIKKASSPGGAYTKSQLEAIGVPWPPKSGWIDEEVGTYITIDQLKEFQNVQYGVHSSSKKKESRWGSASSYKSIVFDDQDRIRLEAVLRALNFFRVPATPHEIARAVSVTAWGGEVADDSVDTILKRLPEVEYVPWGKYILKSKKK